MIFIEILSNRNQKYFQSNRFHSPSYDSLIPSILFHNAEGSFHLNRTIPVCLFTLLCIRTSGTVFALIHFFLLEHWEFHILFHSILFTKNVIVVGTIAGICNRIFRIESIEVFELVHQRHKAAHIAAVLIHLYDGYIFLCGTHLDIIGRKQLVISHIIGLDTHKGCGMVCLGIAVSPFSAYMNLLLSLCHI